jgi:hypothetical protein
MTKALPSMNSLNAAGAKLTTVDDEVRVVAKI